MAETKQPLREVQNMSNKPPVIAASLAKPEANKQVSERGKAK